jgi:hypothetical protein
VKILEHSLFYIFDIMIFVVFIATPRENNKGRSTSLSASASMPSNMANMWQSNEITTNSAGYAVIKTKLQLVDLAGSECVGKFLSCICSR